MLQVVGIDLLASKAELFFTLWLSRQHLALTWLRIVDEILLKSPRVKTYIAINIKLGLYQIRFTLGTLIIKARNGEIQKRYDWMKHRKLSGHLKSTHTPSSKTEANTVTAAITLSNVTRSADIIMLPPPHT